MRISIKTQFLGVIAIIVVMIMLIVSFFMYFQFNSIMKEQISSEFKNVMSKGSMSINDTLNCIFRAKNSLNTNKYFKELLLEQSLDAVQGIQRNNGLINELRITYDSILNESAKGYSVCFIMDNALPAAKYAAQFKGNSFIGNMNGIYTDTNISDSDWYQDILRNASTLHIFKNSENDEYIYFANTIMDISVHNSYVLGVTIVGINFEKMLQSMHMGNGQSGMHFAIVDPNQKLVASLDNKIRQDNLTNYLSLSMDESDDMVLLNKLEYGITLVGVLDGDEISFKIRRVENYFFLCIILILAAVLAISVLISGNITKPIRELSRIMKNVNENEDIQIYTKLPIANEVASLYQSFNKMMFRISQLLDESKLSGMREAEMEMKMLQAQINPHFLYNALDTISMVALMHEEDELSEMITMLSDSFRYSIDDADNLIAISEEIEFIRNYVVFQEWRYEEKIEFFANIPFEYTNIVIPKFIIQPLVENSILHGIGENENKIKIEIYVEKRENEFVISVVDNGIGCDVQKLNHSLLQKKDHSQVLKFGIKNVNERIKLKFGDNYGLSYYDTPGGGVTAKISLPTIGFEKKGNEI